MTIRKSAGCALAATLLLGTVCAIPPQTTDAQAAVTAQSEPAVLTRENASLFLPESYEQYLSLQTPADVAFSDRYIAVADGNTLYLSERGENAAYTSYTASAAIAKIQFADERLYFTVRGTSNSFWYYDTSTQTAQQIGSLNCSTFLIVDGTLYTAVIAANQMTLARRSLDALESEGVSLGTLSTGTEPWLTWANGTLYCVVGGTIYRPNASGLFDDESGYYISDFSQSSGISSVCSDGSDLYFSSSAGFFRRAPGKSASPVLLSSDAQLCGVSALNYENGMFYCISGRSVHEIAVTDTSAAFTEYEIASASASVNRLSAASDTARAGNLLVTADTGNSRVTVYDLSTGEFDAIACEGAPTLVATDGETIACAAGSQVYTCSYAAGETAFTSAGLSGATIAGLAVLYGETCYVKTNGTRGIVGAGSAEADGVTPTGLACDLYGNLYVSYANSNARVFTEEEFVATGTGTDLGFAAAEDATSLRADFEGNLYYLSGGALCKNGEPFASVDGSDFVYGAGSAQPLSFALGYEDDAVYFNFGDYVVVSHASTEAENGPLAGIPTLGEIAEDGARQTTFSLHEAQGLLVTVAARSVGVDTDLAAFRASDSAYFPYCGYSRSRDEQQGLLLASTSEEAGGYSLVVFPEEDGSYTARLYKAASVSPVESTWREESGVRWLSNAVCLSYAPCLEPSPAEGLPSLAAQQLTRGACVTVLGSFTAPDREYTLVEYAGEAREAVRGWVPTAYLSEVSPGLTLGEDYTLAYLKSDEEGIAFTAADGSQMTVTQRVQVRLYDNGDGTYTARLADNTAYSAVVTQDMLDTDNAEVLRIALIVILSVLALVIVGVYLFLLPWDKYRKKRR